MSFYEIILIAIGLAMDAFAVSLSVGTTGFINSPRPVFRIAFHFGFFQFLMPVLGWFIGYQIANQIAIVDHWIAFGLLSFVGFRMIRSGSVLSFLIMPLISLILGISAISDEKESKTLSQLLARPVYREEIVLSKWISTMAVGIIITGIDALIINIGLCIQVNDFTIFFENIDVFLAAWVYLILWFLVYGTIFLFLGILIDKNALGWGLAIAYFEAFFSQFIFGGIGSDSAFSIANHINYVASEFILVDYYYFNIPNYDPAMSLFICIALIVGFFSLSALVMRRKDFP